MLYNLEFVKIGPEFKLAGVGFAGNIFIALNALTYLNDEDRLRVDMSKEECACTEIPNLFNTNNCWEYFFNQIDYSPECINFTSLLQARLHYDTENFDCPELYLSLKEKFYKNFELKKEIKEAIETFYEQHISGKITLGVQVRLTDMKHYHNVYGVERYIEKVKEILTANPSIEQIFVATDDSEVLTVFEKNFDIPVIFHKNMFRATKELLHTEPYDRFDDNRLNHRYLMGVECLYEILTLSKCNFMLKAHKSSISIVACILSENIKKIFTL